MSLLSVTARSSNVPRFPHLFALFAVLAASIHVALSPRRRSSGAAVAETYLLYLLFIYVGLMGLLTA